MSTLAHVTLRRSEATSRSAAPRRDAMLRQAQHDNTALLQPFHLFEQFPKVRIAILRKESGCSSDEEAARMAGFADVAYAEQVHGNDIHVVDSPLAGTVKADGLITDVPNLALSVRWADCQNFVIYAPSRLPLDRLEESSKKTGVLGVLHAGWRGLARGAVTAMFEALKNTFNVDPNDVYVGAGPSLCKKCAVFTNPFKELSKHLHPFIDGKNVDLVAAADAELLSLGVPLSHVERHRDCTACRREKYWTNRGGDREEVQAGRGRNYLVAGMTF